MLQLSNSKDWIFSPVQSECEVKVKFRRCPNSYCNRPFQINQFTTRLSGSIEQGKITCPHCGLLVDGDSESVFLTHALTPEEEAEFETSHPAERELANEQR